MRTTYALVHKNFSLIVTDMLTWIFLSFWFVALQAKEPTHLKPGALVGHLGRVALVEDVLWVKYPYENLRTIPGRLKGVTAEIGATLAQLEKEAYKNANTTSWDDPLNLLKLFSSRLAYVNDTVSLALESYIGLEGPARDKRYAPLGILGELSRDIFGTAMQADVDELRDRYNQLTVVANANNRAIQINCQKLIRLDRHVAELGTFVNRLKLSLDQVFEKLNSFYDFLVLGQALPALENAVNSLLHTNQQIITNVVDAAHGRVTPSLFPVKDLMHALELGKQEYGLTPLFDIRAAHHYYALLTSFLTSEDVVIHVPFQSTDVFEAFRIEPFPFTANGSTLILNKPPSIVLVSPGFTLYATGSMSDLTQCKSAYLSYYHCPASQFAFQTITGGICEVVLTQNQTEKALDLCPYTTIEPTPLTHKTFFSHHYFFFMTSFYVSIICPERTEYTEVTGHLAVYFACYVHSANLSTFPSKLHQGFVGNSTARIYPLTTLDNIHISSVKNLKNPVSAFNFSSTSDLEEAIQDVLPGYLQPYVHYPTLTISIVLCIVIIIPLCCYTRKALTLYKVLQQRKKASVRKQEETNV